jgi:GH25 family lysozyme M1 (1,4-beta-N-acetylmuramidase)
VKSRSSAVRALGTAVLTLVAAAVTFVAPAHAATTGAYVPGAGGSAHAGIDPGAPKHAASNAITAGTPAGYPVLGMDVASYQGDINWSQQVANGAHFAYAKATEGTSYLNPYFNGQYNGAKNAGLYAGAYAFARPDSPDSVAQADYFIDHAQFANDGKTLPVMLDIEWPYQVNGSYVAPYPCYGVSTGATVSWIRAFVNEVRARTGRQTLIYTNTNWWNPCTGNNSSFGDQLLDISHYSTTSTGTLPPGWSNWTVWQYGDAGTFPGDQDAFYGSLTDLAGLAGASHYNGIAGGDFNGDGKTDIAGIDANHNMQFYPGNGAGALVSGGGLMWPSGGLWAGFHGIVAGDFNGDGKTDIAGIDANNNLQLYTGNGTGTLTGAGLMWPSGGLWAGF